MRGNERAMDELVEACTWIAETEKDAKDLAERICQQIAEEAEYAHIDRKWYFDKVVQYMRTESEEEKAKIDKIKQIVDEWNNDASHSFTDMCKINGILKERE